MNESMDEGRLVSKADYPSEGVMYWKPNDQRWLSQMRFPGHYLSELVWILKLRLHKRAASTVL